MIREADVVTSDSAPSAAVLGVTLRTARFCFWPVFGGSGSESLLLEDDDPEDEVADVSDL